MSFSTESATSTRHIYDEATDVVCREALLPGEWSRKRAEASFHAHGGVWEKISRNLSEPLDICFCMAYIRKDYDEHLFAFRNHKYFLSGGMRKMKIKRIPPIHTSDFGKTQWRN